MLNHLLRRGAEPCAPDPSQVMRLFLQTLERIAATDHAATRSRPAQGRRARGRRGAIPAEGAACARRAGPAAASGA